MNRLIEGTLTYARVGLSGAIWEAVNCDEVLTHVLANLGRTISEHGAHIIRHPLPTVIGNSFLLTQVFQNLVHNAVKYHGTAAPQIEINSQSRDGEWVFSVKDNGVGIDPLYQQKVFKIFQRLGSLDESAGSGIGLAICHKALERHRGKIWVQSGLGKGSTFYFTIPMQQRLEVTNSPDTAPTASPEEVRPG
jgi:chemotaxis family two-component system sensor kinase Cph1